MTDRIQPTSLSDDEIKLRKAIFPQQIATIQTLYSEEYQAEQHRWNEQIHKRYQNLVEENQRNKSIFTKIFDRFFLRHPVAAFTSIVFVAVSFWFVDVDSLFRSVMAQQKPINHHHSDVITQRNANLEDTFDVNPSFVVDFTASDDESDESEDSLILDFDPNIALDDVQTDTQLASLETALDDYLQQRGLQP